MSFIFPLNKKQNKIFLIYLNTIEIHIVFPEKWYEILKVFWRRLVMTAVRPDCLKRIHANQIKTEFHMHRSKRRALKSLHSKNTFKTPFSATILPAASVAPPAKKLECWKVPFFFFPTYNVREVLRTKIHLEPLDSLVVLRSSPVCLYKSFPPSMITSYAFLSICQMK